MPPLHERFEDPTNVFRAIQNQIGGDMPRFDFHAPVEVRFVNRGGEIDRLYDTRQKGVVDRRRIFGFEAFKNVSVDLGCRNPPTFVEGQRRVLRRSVYDQAVEVARQAFRNHGCNFQTSREQPEDLLIRRLTDEDASGRIVKKTLDIGFRMTDGRLLEDNGRSNGRGNLELLGPCGSSVQNGDYFRSREAIGLSGLGLQPDSAVGKFYDAIVETLRH